MVKKDDGIAAVVAVMLILAVVVTCMTLYTTVYVPQLKQAAEIEHSGDVLMAFERFAADADTLYANGKNASYAEVVELGGGDVFLSPVKSSGTIQIRNETIGSISIGATVTMLNTTSVSYQPSYSSWEEQGYLYSNGTVWITKGLKRTPASLSVLNASQGMSSEEKWIDDVLKRIQPVAVGAGNVTQVMTMQAGAQPVSGTGVGKLTVTAEVTEQSMPAGDTAIQVNSADGSLVAGWTVKNLTVQWVNLTVSAK